MATRPLRQYYEPVTATIPSAVGGLEPWLRHRQRIVRGLRALPDAEWNAPTRCTEWTVKGVVSHLVTVDAYWMFALGAARTDDPPTIYLEHFDPSTGTDAQVASLRDVPNAELLDTFTTGTAAFVDLAESYEPADWESIGESPLGHLPARVLFGHAFWDSWLHERDIFEPLAREPRVESDELLAVTCFCLLFAGLQGGLIDDPGATGDRCTEPVDVTLRFDDLPAAAVRVTVGAGVGIELAYHATGTSARRLPSSSASPAGGRRPTWPAVFLRTSPLISPARHSSSDVPVPQARAIRPSDVASPRAWSALIRFPARASVGARSGRTGPGRTW